MSLEDCAVCYEPLGDTETMECGHRIHLKCLERHFKPECPVCKTPHTLVPPKGELPRNFRPTRSINANASGEKIKVILNLSRSTTREGLGKRDKIIDKRTVNVNPLGRSTNFDGNFTPWSGDREATDIEKIENYLTRKHRGERMNKLETVEYNNIVRRVGAMTIVIEKV